VISSALELNGRAFDDPWRRLPWTFAVAMLISVVLLSEFGRLMNRPEPLPEPKPIEAQLVELPPPEAPPPKPEPVRISKPVAPPKREPVPEKPQVNLPRETAPAPEPARPQEQAPAPPQPAPPPAAAPTTRSSSTDTGNMGAQAIDKPLPKIPDDLREQAFSLTAVARFHIAADGTATVELATPTPNPRLNRLLLDSLRNWKFFPAMKDGRPVASVQDVRVQFEVK